MATLTIRGFDETLAKTLRGESHKRNISMNRLVLDILGEALKVGSSKRHFDDLDHLAGTWSEVQSQEFNDKVLDLGKVDPADWK